MSPEIFSFLQTQVSAQPQKLLPGIITQENTGTMPGIFDALISEYALKKNSDSLQPEITAQNLPVESSQPAFTNTAAFSGTVIDILADKSAQDINAQPNYLPENEQEPPAMTHDTQNIHDTTEAKQDLPVMTHDTQEVRQESHVMTRNVQETKQELPVRTHDTQTVKQESPVMTHDMPDKNYAWRSLFADVKRNPEFTFRKHENFAPQNDFDDGVVAADTHNNNESEEPLIFTQEHSQEVSQEDSPEISHNSQKTEAPRIFARHDETPEKPQSFSQENPPEVSQEYSPEIFARDNETPEKPQAFTQENTPEVSQEHSPEISHITQEKASPEIFARDNETPEKPQAFTQENTPEVSQEHSPEISHTTQEAESPEIFARDNETPQKPQTFTQEFSQEVSQENPPEISHDTQEKASPEIFARNTETAEKPQTFTQEFSQEVSQENPPEISHDTQETEAPKISRHTQESESPEIFARDDVTAGKDIQHESIKPEILTVRDDSHVQPENDTRGITEATSPKEPIAPENYARPEIIAESEIPPESDNADSEGIHIIPATPAKAESDREQIIAEAQESPAKLHTHESREITAKPDDSKTQETASDSEYENDVKPEIPAKAERHTKREIHRQRPAIETVISSEDPVNSEPITKSEAPGKIESHAEQPEIPETNIIMAESTPMQTSENSPEPPETHDTPEIINADETSKPRKISEPRTIPNDREISESQVIVNAAEVVQPREVSQPREVVQPHDVSQSHEVAQPREVVQPHEVSEAPEITDAQEISRPNTQRKTQTRANRPHDEITDSIPQEDSHAVTSESSRTTQPRTTQNQNGHEEITDSKVNQPSESQDGKEFSAPGIQTPHARISRTEPRNESRTDSRRIDALNDFQTFFDSATRTRRSSARVSTRPLSLRTGTYESNGVQSQSRTLRNGIVNTVRFIRADGVRKANIIVDPPALGRISVELTSSSSGVEASVKVANEQIRQIVQEQFTQLRDNLLQQGVQVSEFTVDVQQDSSRQGQDSGERNQRENYTFTPSEDDDDTENFRADLEEGLLYWIA